MTNKEFQNRKKEIRKLIEQSEHDEAMKLAHELVIELHSQKEYDKVVELYRSKFIEPKSYLYSFEVAYALVVECHDIDNTYMCHDIDNT